LAPQPLPNPIPCLAEDGDPFEVEQAYRSHGAWLLAFLRRRFGRQDAEDLAQETYLRAATITVEVRNPRALLVRIALNAARDQVRRRKARPVLVRPDAAPAPADPAAQAEALLLKQAILALPPKLREVFLLSRFGGLTYEEIAHRLQISVKTVEGRMTKALAMCTALMS
jgi:RNA polymerase sigma-70 factor (ECF subfamily)